MRGAATGGEEPACYIADRATLANADELIRHFGHAASYEANARADEARGAGNLAGFCRWRQVARLIPLLIAPAAVGTVH